MPTVLLIRHGENEFVAKRRLAGRLPGVHLNERGRAQAQALAEALKDVKLSAIYSSPLERALETARPLAAAQGLRIVRRPALAETRLGDWEGKPIRSLQRDKRWRQLQERPAHFRFPGGESMLEQQARLVGEVQALVAKHKPRQAFACVGHADPLKLVIAHYLGLPLDHFQRLMIDTASVSVLNIQDGHATLLKMNWKPRETP
jgi:probable phosphoglycerate mutase